MLIIDSLLISGIRFVLDKVAAAVDTELNDDTALREQLLAAQMRVELGGSGCFPIQPELQQAAAVKAIHARPRKSSHGDATAPASLDGLGATTS